MFDLAENTGPEIWAEGFQGYDFHRTAKQVLKEEAQSHEIVE
jgi:hypothetical protein